MSALAMSKKPDALLWIVFGVAALVLLLVISVPSLIPPQNPGTRAGGVHAPVR